LGRTRRCGGEMLSGRNMMVVVVLPVMLRDSSPSTAQYIRGQERRLAEDVYGCIMVWM
jgi:hypothetical protein